MSDYDPTQKDWSIMTKSRGGTVSVIRDLTEELAAKTYERLDPFYGQTCTLVSIHKDFLPENTYGAFSGAPWPTYNDGDIEVREVFGPPGWKWFSKGMVKSWPIYKTVWADANGNILPNEYQENVEEANLKRKEREIMM